jgi:alpha-glucosidase
VDAVWLTPFYPSALADGGYDVDDYRQVDPRLGTLEHFDAMVRDLHAAGIHIIVDIVPNHSSNRHAWFVEALASPPGSPARERYIFRPGVGPDRSQPPADWRSKFGGPAWTSAGDDEFYLHTFAREQPDLNWDNPEVREDFLTTLRFWADRGVDGFRVDVAHGLVKDLTEPLPSWAELESHVDPDGLHPLHDRDEVHEVYEQWRTVFDEYDPPRAGIAEAWVHPSRQARYASPRGLGQAFNFDLLRADFDAEQFRHIVEFNLGQASEAGSSSTWVLSNHDVVRHPTRYGLPPRGEEEDGPDQDWLRSGGAEPPLNRELGLARAHAATLFVLALPGSTYLYQGEELGLHEVVEIPDDQRQDPTFFRTHGEYVGRDGCRVPLPWTSAPPAFGFSTAPAHLPQPDWFAEVSVEAESAEADSTLSLYRRALRLRRELATVEDLEWIPAPAGVVHFSRPGGWHCITNFDGEPVALPEGDVLLTTAAIGDGMLPAPATAWVRVPTARA